MTSPANSIIPAYSQSRSKGDVWYKSAIFYHLYPLGMLGAEHYNEQRDSQPRLRELHGILPKLKELGINALFLGPVFESSTHGYDTRDYYHVDKRLGSNEDLRCLIDACHREGFRVIVDGVFNHVGRSFWAFKDVEDKRQASAYQSWFSGLRCVEHSNTIAYDTWEGHDSLIKLKLDHPEVREHLFGAVRSWVEDFGFDGIRLDAADCLSPSFIAALRCFCKSLRHDCYLMGEVIHGDYRQWANADMLDGTTNYEAYKGLWSSHNDKNFHEIAYTLKRQFDAGGIYSHLDMYSFVDNHDVSRIASLLNSPLDLYSIYALMFLMPGAPSVYYGSEWGILGQKGRGFEADYPVRPRLSADQIQSGKVGQASEGASLWKAIQRLCKLRSEHPSLSYGGYRQLEVSAQTLIFERLGDERLICAVSALPVVQTQKLKVDNGRYRDLLNDQILEVCDGHLNLELFPHWARVLVKL